MDNLAYDVMFIKERSIYISVSEVFEVEDIIKE